MSAPYGNIRSKLSRALAAYLATFNSPPVGNGPYTNVFSQFSEAQKTYPNTVCRVVQGQSEPPLSGDYICKVQIHIRGSAANVTAAADLDSIRAAFDSRCAATHDAFMVTDSTGQDLTATALAITAAARALAASSPANNADLADFTLIMWNDNGFGEGNADAAGCSWEEVFVFEALCCAKNVS